MFHKSQPSSKERWIKMRKPKKMRGKSPTIALVLVILALTLITARPESPRITQTAHAASDSCDTADQVCYDIWEGMRQLCYAAGGTDCLAMGQRGYRMCMLQQGSVFLAQSEDATACGRLRIIGPLLFFRARAFREVGQEFSLPELGKVRQESTDANTSD